ncbi:MAG: sulfatase-like hydrolase/transferase [bacterium]
MSHTPPNILLIVTDQQRGDCIGVDAQAPPCLSTPNLDDLAATGARFSRAYSECPTCMPARRTLYAGLAPAAQGMVGMTNLDFDPPAKLPAMLSAAGYQTELIGKTHLEPAAARHGFDHMMLANGTRGDWGSCRYTEFLIRNGYDIHRPGVSHGVYANSWVGRPTNLPEELTHTYWCVTEAMDFLQHRDPTCPFFLNVGLIDPHPAFVPPAYCYERYAREDLPPPPIGDWAAADRPDRHTRQIEAARIDLNPSDRRAMLAGYYGLITHIDNQVGRLLMFLRDRKLLDNTLVLFTSDHGEMLGDHYRFQKARPYEGSARIPLIVRPPKTWNLAPTCPDAPVGLQDIMPTLLDAAGIDVPQHCTGKSLLPLVRGEKKPPRDILHGEHTDQYGHNEGMHYLTDGRHKYIWYTHDGVEQFFDLTDDPRECHDLSDSADLRPWRDRLMKILDGRPEGFTDGKRLIPGCPYDKIISTYQPGVALAFE